MNRFDLIKSLKTIAPALGTKTLVPTFKCAFFSEEEVTAYDDVVAISTPLQAPFTGGVDGATLMNWLGASRAKNIVFESMENTIRAKGGRSRIDLPLFPSDESPFRWPSWKSYTEIDDAAEWYDPLDMASTSLGVDSTHPWRLGVTVSFDEDGVLLYSSDNLSGCRVTMPGGYDVELPPMIIPPRWVELFLSIGKRDTPKTIYVSSKAVVAEFASGTLLFSKTVRGADLKRISMPFDGVDDIETYPIPKGFELGLERVSVVLQGAAYQYVQFTTGNVLRIIAKSPIGEVNERFKVPAQDPLDVRTFPSILKRAITHSNRMAITENFILFTGESFAYMGAIVHGEDE